MNRQWLPKTADAPGLVLAGAVGVAALALVRSVPATPWLSDILIALLLGFCVLNSPLRHLIGLQLPGPKREPDRYASGLRYTGKWLLRLGIILMGLKVRTTLFGGRELLLIAGVIVVAVPCAFMMAHALAALLGLRRPLGDLLGIGTMICGASAVNAAAPIAQARRDEQGIAIGAIFLFSVVALLSYQPIATALDLPPAMAGIWAGLAVNELSSAVAVGKQMGGNGAVMSAAAKSARILALAPTLIWLSLSRRQGAASTLRQGVLKQGIANTLPKFILGYIALAIARTLGDRLAATSVGWETVLWLDDVAVDLLLCTVAAAIGLHLSLRRLVASGGRAIAVGGGTSVWMASIALAMVTATARDAGRVAALVGVAALLLSFAAFRLAATDARRERALWRRLDEGDRLSLGEAAVLLGAAETAGRFDERFCVQLMSQLQPAIGELIPIRDNSVQDSGSCRWTPYWEGDNGWSLGATLRPAGSVTSVHTHSEIMIGKAIEGDIDEVCFTVDGDRLQVTSRKKLAHNDVTVRPASTEPHLIHVAGATNAIDLQLRGPSEEAPSKSYRSRWPALSALQPGTRWPLFP